MDINPVDFIGALARLNREEAEEKKRREEAFRKSRPYLGRSEDAIRGTDNYCCSICGTEDDLDMPGLCRGAKCRAQARSRLV